MKSLIAWLVLLAFAEVISGQTTSSRATRLMSTRPAVPTTKARAPTRQQGGIAPPRPTPSRSTPGGPTRQQNNPTTAVRPPQGQPTRPPVGGPTQPTRPPAGGPTQPTRPPVGGPTQPTRSPNGPTTPRQQNPPGGDGWPSIPSDANPPTAPTAAPSVNPGRPGERPATRSPRVGTVGISDPRCPLDQNPRNPVHLPHSTNCERFWKCDYGIAYEYQCPIGQHWNAQRNYCDFPTNANCGAMNIGNNGNEWNNVLSNNWNLHRHDPRNPDFQHHIQIPMAPGK